MHSTPRKKLKKGLRDVVMQINDTTTSYYFFVSQFYDYITLYQENILQFIPFWLATREIRLELEE